MNDTEPPPYQVIKRDGRFEVVSDSKNVTVVCQDQANAEQYALLQNEAYQRGYKAGVHHARVDPSD